MRSCWCLPPLRTVILGVLHSAICKVTGLSLMLLPRREASPAALLASESDIDEREEEEEEFEEEFEEEENSDRLNGRSIRLDGGKKAEKSAILKNPLTNSQICSQFLSYGSVIRT